MDDWFVGLLIGLMLVVQGERKGEGIVVGVCGCRMIPLLVVWGKEGAKPFVQYIERCGG